MTYQVLARKWRPKTFEEVIGQDHITRTLKNAIQKNKVAHAYLFTGTRGVGKTTVARIFAKAIMCQNKKDQFNPCLECESCKAIDNSTSIDYTEIDGASNNSVENIRDLIDSVQYLPTNGQFKVYVIDEVHMLSVSAFNALLKTLEEPPAHVVFIFATTDPQKLLGTVLSRCQRFDFKSVTNEILRKHILHIAECESFRFETDKVLTEICKQGKGSVRDTLSLLDQVLSLSINDVISEELLMLSLGLADTSLITSLLNAIFLGNKNHCIQSYKKIVKENVDFKKFVTQFLESIFLIIENIDEEQMLDGDFEIDKDVLESLSIAEILWIYESLSKDLDWAINSFNPEANIELSLIKVSLRKQIFSEGSKTLTVRESKKKVKNSDIDLAKEIETIQENKDFSEDAVIHTARIEKETNSDESLQNVEKNWETFLDFLFKEYKTLAVNAERGNLINELNLLHEELNFNLGFSEENQIFYDFMMEAKAEFKERIAHYFGREIGKIKLRITLLTQLEKQTKNFMSKVEQDEHKIALKQNQLREKLLGNKYIQEAQDLFSSKVSKVILNEDD